MLTILLQNKEVKDHALELLGYKPKKQKKKVRVNINYN